MRKELSLGLALYALIIQTTPAAQSFQLYSCVEEELYPILERFNDADKELELREGRLRDIDEKIAAIDKEYPFCRRQILFKFQNLKRMMTLNCV